MTDDPLFVGFFTTGGRYEQAADGLRVSLDALGLDHEFLGIESRGTWDANTRAKAGIVLGFMDRFPGRPDDESDVLSQHLKRRWLPDTDPKQAAANSYLRSMGVSAG